MRKQAFELVRRVRGDAPEHVAEPGEWVHAGPLTGSHEAGQHRRGLTALMAAEERSYPIPAYRFYHVEATLG